MKKLLKYLSVVGVILLGVAIYLQQSHKEPTDYIVLYGNVDVRQVQLGFRVLGRVAEMPFQEGDLVQPGQLVARLDQQPFADQVRVSEANLLAVRTSLANAERLLVRREGIVGRGGVSTEDFENARSSRDVLAANLKQAEATLGVAQTDLKDTEVFAPSKGTILTRIREPGAVVKPSDPVCTLTLTDPVWIRAFVSEHQLGQVYPGMPAVVQTDTPNGKEYKGQVGFISPVAEFTPKTVETTQLRTDLVYRLRIIADNPDEGLRQGMPVTVVLDLTAPKGRNSP